jgi:hypothetical protein
MGQRLDLDSSACTHASTLHNPGFLELGVAYRLGVSVFLQVPVNSPSESQHVLSIFTSKLDHVSSQLLLLFLLLFF